MDDVSPMPVVAGGTVSAEALRGEAPLDEAPLGAALRGGDQAAMADLYDRFGERIYNYCYRRTASWSEAEDLTSEVFLTAWRTRARAAQPDEALLPWLYAIATNVLRNHQRSRSRGERAVRRLPVGPDAPGADVAVEHLDADQRLHAALDRLSGFPASHQDIFWLATWEQLDYEAIAAVVGCPVGTVRSRLSRMRQALRLTDEALR